MQCVRAAAAVSGSDNLATCILSQVHGASLPPVYFKACTRVCTPQNGTVNASTVRGSYHLPNAVCRGGCLNVCLTLQNVASKGYVPHEYLKTCVIVSPKHVDYLKTCSTLYPECVANNFSKSPEYLTNSSPVSQNMW